MKTSRLKLVDPAVKCRVGSSGRKPNTEYRKREYLTQDELAKLFAALKANRHGHRDHMIALVTFLHGLRVSELIDLRWDDIDWRKGTIQIRRLKGSMMASTTWSATRPMASSGSSVSKTLRAATSSPANAGRRSLALPSIR